MPVSTGRERKKVRSYPVVAMRPHGGARTPQPSRPGSRQAGSSFGPRRLSPLQASADQPISSQEPLEWDMQVERALSSQQLSQSWSEVLREKQIALEAAIDEVRTRRTSMAGRPAELDIKTHYIALPLVSL